MAAATKFDAESITAIITAKRNGKTDEQSAKAAGISARTLRAWLTAGRNGNHEFHPLLEAYIRAVSECRKERTKQILKAAGIAA